MQEPSQTTPSPQQEPPSNEVKPASSLYGTDDTLGNEQVKDVVDIIPAGYTAIVGKTYRVKGKEGKRSSNVTDFFLLSFTSEDGAVSGKITDIRIKDGKQHLVLRKSKTSGEYIVDNIIKSVYNGDVLGSDKATTQNFIALQKKKFAQKFGAFDSKTNQIDWTKIQSSACRIVSFNIVQNGKYTNIDTDSIELIGNERVSEESVLFAYKTILDVWASRKPSQETSSAPDWGDTGIESAEAPHKIEDDLPF